MAATVVSVVIFLCGVFVGRGVRAERANAVADASGTAAPVADITPAVPSAKPTPAPAGSDPTAAAPPPTVDDLSYPNRLDSKKPVAEDLKPANTKGTKDTKGTKESAAAPVEKPAPGPKHAAANSQAGADAGARPWAVQVAALNVRAEADAIAKKLTSKGYPAYVVEPAAGTSVYRVRVGRFASQREAEPMKARLEKEEQFKPWITR
jgi:cell division septation protein DedD